MMRPARPATSREFSAYTCFGCHEHEKARIEGKHREEGIRDIANCVRCHSSANGEHGEGGARQGPRAWLARRATRMARRGEWTAARHDLGQDNVREHASIGVGGSRLERGARALRPLRVHDAVVALIDAIRPAAPVDQTRRTAVKGFVEDIEDLTVENAAFGAWSTRQAPATGADGAEGRRRDRRRDPPGT